MLVSAVTAAGSPRSGTGGRRMKQEGREREGEEGDWGVGMGVVVDGVRVRAEG